MILAESTCTLCKFPAQSALGSKCKAIKSFVLYALVAVNLDDTSHTNKITWYYRWNLTDRLKFYPHLLCRNSWRSLHSKLTIKLFGNLIISLPSECVPCEPFPSFNINPCCLASTLANQILAQRWYDELFLASSRRHVHLFEQILLLSLSMLWISPKGLVIWKPFCWEILTDQFLSNSCLIVNSCNA